VSYVTGNQHTEKIEEMSVFWVQQHVTVSKTLVASAIAIGFLRHAQQTPQISRRRGRDK